MRNDWLIYGATGYTARRTAAHAVSRGFTPVLAGRDANGTRELAEGLSLEWMHLTLDDGAQLRKRLTRFTCVLNMAGPFSRTWRPLLEACLAAGTHYLDIGGEVDVYESLASQDAAAREAGIMILPGVGFDMVPGDCLALHLKTRMPDAVSLDMAISAPGTFSRGTLKSALAAFQPGVLVRRNHQLRTLDAPLGREFDFGEGAGSHLCQAITFGDVSIGWRTTRIPDITVYLRITAALTALSTIDSEAKINTMPEGPPEDELNSLRATLVAEVRNEAGDMHRCTLVTPQIYQITFALASDIAMRVHRGALAVGFQTPAALFGSAFILGFQGCTRQSDL